MHGFIRVALVAASVSTFFLGVAFYFQAEWVKDFWPWSGGYGNLSTLSYYFVSSILMAIAMPNLWIGLTGEFAALVGGAIDLGVTGIGVGIYMFQGYNATGNDRLLIGSLICVIQVALAVVIFFWTWRIPFKDERPLPQPLRLTFGVFAIVLLVVGGLLIFKRPNIFPWPLRDEVSVVYGWVFLGAACYFVYGVAMPRWSNAAGQMVGFLAYDLILILPFIRHFDKVSDDHRISLIIYTMVVISSGALASYYLFIYPATRIRPVAGVKMG